MQAKFYLVGGALRDELLGLKSKDLDYAVECESFDAMREAVLAKGGKIFLETPQFFTIRAMVPNLGAADFVLCRRDGAYTDGRRPDSVTIGTIYDDLARRDFTMNAIARDVDTGAIIDPFNGVKAISNRLISCVGSPLDRFAEDKLRMFRAVRFAVTKNFELDKGIDLLIKGGNWDFSGVSVDRVRDELMKMFAKDTPTSIDLLVNCYPKLWNVVIEKKIWLKPTTEQV